MTDTQYTLRGDNNLRVARYFLPGDALGGHDSVEGLAGDGVVLADEVSHRLQQLDDVSAVVVLHHVNAKSKEC